MVFDLNLSRLTIAIEARLIVVEKRLAHHILTVFLAILDLHDILVFLNMNNKLEES